MKNCLGKNGINSAVKAIEGVSLEEYAAEIRKNAKTYTYPELDSIINTKLQKEYGQTKGLVAFLTICHKALNKVLPSIEMSTSIISVVLFY